MERCSCDMCKKVWDDTRYGASQVTAGGNASNPTKVYTIPNVNVRMTYNTDEFPNTVAWGDSVASKQTKQSDTEFEKTYAELQATQRQLSLRNEEIEALHKQIAEMVSRFDYDTLLDCYDAAVDALGDNQDINQNQQARIVELLRENEELEKRFFGTIEELKSAIVILAKHL